MLRAGEVAQLPLAGPRPLVGVSQVDDAQATQQVLAGQHCDWLVVDHYGLDATWESMLRPHADKILVIDDLADCRHDCDVLLDQNFYLDAKTRYIGKLLPGCQQMLGPRYALLRETFRIARTLWRAPVRLAVYGFFRWRGCREPDRARHGCAGERRGRWRGGGRGDWCRPSLR